jgi:putative flippase GtrA
LRKFFRFCLVGAVGFAADFLTLYLLTQRTSIGPIVGRLASFLIAATVTWKLNRSFTFSSKNSGMYGEWMRYILTTLIGGLVNIGVYKMWLLKTDGSALNLLIGVVLGSAAAMLFNFFILTKAVFIK